MNVHTIRPPDLKQVDDLRNRVELLSERKVSYASYMLNDHKKFLKKTKDFIDIMKWTPQGNVPWAIQDKIDETYNETEYRFTGIFDATLDHIRCYGRTMNDLAQSSDRLLVLEATPILPVEIKFTTEELEARYPKHIKKLCSTPVPEYSLFIQSH